jgi:hypothetical protein
MDYSKLITRQQYERVLRADGRKGAHRLPYSELERIAAEIAARNRAAYKASVAEGRA